MLDHLTGGRLEIGTAIGVPQELSRLNVTMAEARERNDEIVAFLNAALTNRIVSHRGKYFSFFQSAHFTASIAATVSSALDDSH
jgi:alkanesulfonate monooxygenase SsuD/methylene tetrahydromethanopterin reductase-like flavin-dependent oxidoreductase (luciferase family)